MTKSLLIQLTSFQTNHHVHKNLHVTKPSLIFKHLNPLDAHNHLASNSPPKLESKATPALGSCQGCQKTRSRVTKCWKRATHTSQCQCERFSDGWHAFCISQHVTIQMFECSDVHSTIQMFRWLSCLLHFATFDTHVNSTTPTQRFKFSLAPQRHLQCHLF